MLKPLSLLFTIALLTLSSCNSQNKPMSETYTNALIDETSPYLLQHANNPVNWQPWGDKALQDAKDQNKLLLISIGYAACHWCHVMEHESFEDTTVATVMNANFINIKVDREERPDVDQVYMNAVQLMTGRGGWPLNVIALPDGRPIWGGTYLPKKQWVATLNQLSDIYESSPEKMVEYADKLDDGLQQVALLPKNETSKEFSIDFISEAVSSWEVQFDYNKGGMQSAPKFMMPNNYHFLMRYAHQLDDGKLMDYVQNTLTKISYGGVYDHIGGGFSRYSVDDKWHVPHFEKMLYDNAQLVSLYSDAYLLTGNDWYKTVIEETLNFVKHELTRNNGSFYSSLDADSKDEEGELEEGAYYVWTKTALKNLLGEDFKLFKSYYNINDFGKWEDNTYVLIRTTSNTEISKEFSISEDTLKSKVKSWKALLLKERDKREKPRLDDKSLTSWNALMLQAYTDAFRVLGDSMYLKAAIKNARFITSEMLKEDGRLLHSYNNNEAKINGYLEDYALVSKAFMSLYEQTLDDKWLKISKQLTDYAFNHFYNDKSGMFFFTSDLDKALITRQIDYQDNVIPSSNSVMAKNLFLLSHYFDDSRYSKIAEQQLKNILPDAKEYAGGYSNWLDLMLNQTKPFYELVVVGLDASEKLKTLQKTYIPNKLIAGSKTPSSEPLLENRYVEEQTFIYVCVNKSCKLPTASVEKAKALMQ